MPTFNYKARNARGELLEGELDGIDNAAIARYLINIGATPIEIKLGSDSDISSWTARLGRYLAPPITDLDVQLFSQHMQTLLKAGVPIMQSLKSLEQSAVNRNFAAVIRKLYEALDAGRELSSAMRDHPKVFSQYYVSMIQVGEMTGRLNEIFPRLHDYIEFETNMRDQVEAALRYPKFVIFAMSIAIGVITTFVIPEFAKVFSKAHFELPVITRGLLALSAFVLNYWPVIVLMVAAGVVGFRAFVATKEGRYAWDRFKLRLPVSGEIINKGTMARFARSYALAYRSGVPVSQALSVVAKTVDNAYIASAIEQLRDGVERGESMSRTATISGVFMPRVLQMITIGEETGEMDRLMDEIASMYEREVQYALRTLSARIEPVMIMCIGVLVLLLALGVFVPMWDMGQVQLMKGSI